MPRFAKFPVSWRRRWQALALMLLCLVAGLAHAQGGANDRADPPSRVARLSYIAGDLGFLPAGAKDWSDANINRPLTRGDKLSTARGARAELEFGGGTLRMDGRTDFGLLDLNDNLAQLELTQGTLSLTVRRLDDGQSYEIDTPTVALVADQPGTFRVDVDDRDGSTRVTALDGRATVFGENNAQRPINPGRSYLFTDSSLATVTITDDAGGDAFDDWASQRDRRYTRSSSRRYVSEDVVGYQDLDRYGSWRETREYGAVWYPSEVGVDWAPYRSGHWAYIAPWGWTWVDDAPWGFAPYHYGRWAYLGGGWGWIPGPLEVRPVYAPALVAFVGGGGWSIDIGSAPVGWFPLGPGEVYNPWYRCDRSYYTRVNVTNIYVHNTVNRTTVINNINNQYNYYRTGRPLRDASYANRMAPRGFTAVPGRSFAEGHRVQRDLLDVDPRKLAGAPVPVRGIDRLRPQENADRPPRSAHARDLPAGGFDREVVARRAPPAPREAAFPRPGDNRFATPRSNVRVLDDMGRPGRSQRPDLTDRNDASPRRPATMPGQLPVAPRITAADPGDRPQMSRDAAELRSARFAHPRGRDDANRPEAMPRPGVSYITPAAEGRPRAIPDNRPLPSEPAPIRGAEFRRLPTPADDGRVQRYPSERAMQQQRPQPMEPTLREPAAPRFQRPEPAPREYVHEAPRPLPAPDRSEPMPRYQPPQRAMPEPRGMPEQRAMSEPRGMPEPRAMSEPRGMPEPRAMPEPHAMPQPRAETRQPQRGEAPNPKRQVREDQGEH